MRKKVSYIFLFFFVLLLFLASVSLSGFARTVSSYEKFLVHHDFYRAIIMYFRYAKETMATFTFDYKDLLFAILVDFPFSLVCLLIALRSLPGRHPYEFKSFVWFIFAINIGRFVAFIFFKGVWMVIKTLVIDFRPHWKVPLIDSFYMGAILACIIIYIWLTARTFKVDALEAVRTFIVSHVIYCGIVYIFITFVPDNRATRFVNKNMGLRTIVQSYILDVDKVSQGGHVLSLLRIKPFHM